MVCGCYSQVASNDLKKDFGIDILIGNKYKNNVIELINEYFNNHKQVVKIDNLLLEKEFEKKRKKAIEEKLEDYWQGEDIDEEKMDWIVQQLPLTYQQRPQWDIEYFSSLEGISVETEENFGDLVWDYEEQLNYGATPMFCIKIVKGDA